MAGPEPAFDPWLRRWDLGIDGPIIITSAAQLMPVRRDGAALMLRLSDAPEADRSTALMRWWNGDGAAAVIDSAPGALLMARATGSADLAALARGGEDAAACRILCDVAIRLHRPRPAAPPADLVPLSEWFAALWPFAAAQGGIWARAAATARRLLDDPREVVPLHGDLHHGNVLDFGDRGWLAIDPHALLGDRGFDFGNIFPNPDLDRPSPPLAVLPHVFATRLPVVAEAAGIERQRLLEWVLARSGLSAAWFAEDDSPLVAVDRAIAELAAAALDHGQPGPGPSPWRGGALYKHSPIAGGARAG